MKKSTHSKIKNTGILFELLTRQITADTMTGKNSPALKILREFFGAKTDLAKELVLYQTLFNETFKTERKAAELINATLKLRKRMDQKTLDEVKYDLIREVKAHYDLKDFFKSTIKDYKIYASIYRVFESRGATEIADIIRSKQTITEHIMRDSNASPIVETANAITQQEEDVRLLALKLMIEKFNDKYSTLTGPQKTILREYINNVSDTTALRDFVKKESATLQRKLTAKAKEIDDTITSVKLAEVIHLLDRNKKVKRVEESNIHSLLLYHELMKEL